MGQGREKVKKSCFDEIKLINNGRKVRLTICLPAFFERVVLIQSSYLNAVDDAEGITTLVDGREHVEHTVTPT